MKKKLWACSAAAIAIALAPSGPADAQTTDDASPRSEQENVVIVTARRVEENLQETPASVAIFNSAEIERRTLTDMVDLTRVAPSMRFAGQGNIASTDISLRGVNRVPVGTGGPTTVVYFLDVPIQNSTFMPTYDLGSLQVLRGPQGTLFGTSTIGGAVLVTPRLPGFAHEGYVKATGGEHNYYQLEAAGNIPLIDDVLSVRLAAQIRRRDSYVTNLGPGPDFNDIHTDAYRASIRFEPNASLTNTLVADYIKGDEVGWATIPFARNPSVPPFSTAADRSIMLGPDATDTDVVNPFYRRETWGVFNTTEWRIADNLEIKNIVSYRDSMDAFVIDSDATSLSLFAIGRLTHERDITEELQLVGDSFDDRLHWTIGGFYQKTTPVEAGSLSAATGQLVSNLTTQDESRALFANVALDFTERLTLNAGYRHSWIEQSNCISPVTAGTTRDACEAFAATSTSTDGFGFVNVKGDAPTWTIGLDFKATENIFLYAVHRRGFRFGGASAGNYEHPCLNGGAAPPCLAPIGATGRAIDISGFQNVDDETLNDIEIGMRSDWTIGGRDLRFNITGFHYVYDDLIGSLPLIGLLDPTLPGAPFASTVAFNSGQVTATGVEIDAIANPFDGLTLSFSGSYTDQEQTEDGAGPASFPFPIAPATLAAPKMAGSLAVRYVLPVRPFESEASINFDYYKTGSFQVQATPLPGYELANLRLDFANVGGAGFDAGFWVRNLFDEEYVQSAGFVGSAPLPAKTGNIGDPRMWGVDLVYRWGE